MFKFGTPSIIRLGVCTDFAVTRVRFVSCKSDFSFFFQHVHGSGVRLQRRKVQWHGMWYALCFSFEGEARHDSLLLSYLLALA